MELVDHALGSDTLWEQARPKEGTSTIQTQPPEELKIVMEALTKEQQCHTTTPSTAQIKKRKLDESVPMTTTKRQKLDVENHKGNNHTSPRKSSDDMQSELEKSDLTTNSKCQLVIQPSGTVNFVERDIQEMSYERKIEIVVAAAVARRRRIILLALLWSFFEAE